MKRTALLVALFCAWTTALVAWGQVQRQTLPVASRPADDTQQEIARLKVQVEELARLKAEVDRLTKYIKVSDSSSGAVRIEASLIALNGTVSINENGAHGVQIYSNAFFFGKPYAHQTEFTIIK